MQAEAIETEVFEGTQRKWHIVPMGFPYEMVRAEKVSGFGDSANVEMGMFCLVRPMSHPIMDG